MIAWGGDRLAKVGQVPFFAVAGLATFALLYTPQPLLPQLSRAFHAGPAAASLAMSAGPAALARPPATR